MSDSQIPLYELEKAVLAVGNIKGGDKAIGTVIELFKDARPPFFVQFRQWALITFEHIAKKDDVEALSKLLTELRSKMKGRSSDDFWTLRIESLVQRLKRL